MSSTGGSGMGTTRVFVTPQKYTGALGHLMGADGECQTLADAESLGGSWMAWLGDGVDGPATRFVQSPYPYQLVGGSVIAQDWQSSCLAALIMVTSELGDADRVEELARGGLIYEEETGEPLKSPFVEGVAIALRGAGAP